MPTQTYEEYWKLTLEYTDFNDTKFLKTLEIIVNKIDQLNQHGNYEYASNDYQELQEKVLAAVPKTSSRENQLASTRKAINQCVKLGFINPELKSYHPNTREYLNANSDRKRATLFSKIVYSNSSFNRSITTLSGSHQLNFLINTLIEIGKLSKNQITALMLVDIDSIQKWYLTKEELDIYVARAIEINFLERKHNQISYILNIIKKLDDIVFMGDELYFTEDANRIFWENLEVITRKRNPYLHLLFKNQLKSESASVYHSQEKCMVEKLAYPVLIASHIKPFFISNDVEAYDPNNGFLLSRNIDSLFDLGYITFTENGEIIFIDTISPDVREFIWSYRLDPVFLNPERLRYLDFHRTEVFRKNRVIC